MLEFLKTSEGLMKSKLNMESLTKPELLMLFSILEGELEARDLVIDALKGQGKELFIQERYGKYNLSDPFQALQRDSEAVGDQLKEPGCPSATSNPLVVLKLVVGHCRRMQEKMMAQLAAAESRHRRVIADLEEEKRRHAEDTAEGDDVTYILEKERERLQQQLEFERSQVRRLEKEQRRMTEQIEEERAQHKQLSCALAKECKWASSRALEEGHRLSEVNRKLDKEKESCQALRNELEDERWRALRMEARVEEQLAEFDTEREQLRSRLKKEEAHCCQLQQQVQELKRKLEERGVAEEVGAPVQVERKEWATRPPARQIAVDMVTFEDLEEDTQQHEQPNVPDCTEQTDGHPDPDSALSDDICLHNGDEDSPVHQSQASSSNLPPSSPCSSPVLAKRPPGSPSPGNYQSPYQAGINQRFHAARHKFQGTIDPEPQTQAAQPALPPSPKDAPPVTSSPPLEASPVKQMARSTVTQVLSRFTTGQQNAAPKSASPNNSPFGTDYRSLAAPLSPVITRAAGALQQGIRSPTIPRADRGNPPPIPPKKPSLAQAPPSPAAVPRSAGHFADSALSGSCGLTSSQEGVKELDMVVSSN
ncbi:CTTNBP2 N-terminal-like protein [Gymnodraco acuticeps]|uniref:CTTNBP2 N-terminal-like protein n=1 Tax=Gymnodraco acuticeps TaxID=8218 RepID=A0A6P8STI7_GYMAC|nr:CTTNBP2 N-terminal-like protein [Gymnodraco acuticeps]